MPRFFFNIDGDRFSDTDGTDLDDLAAAKCKAVRMAGRINCDRAGTFWGTIGLRMTVTDDRGLILFALNFVGTESRQVPRPPV